MPWFKKKEKKEALAQQLQSKNHQETTPCAEEPEMSLEMLCDVPLAGIIKTTKSMYDNAGTPISKEAIYSLRLYMKGTAFEAAELTHRFYKEKCLIGVELNVMIVKNHLMKGHGAEFYERFHNKAPWFGNKL